VTDISDLCRLPAEPHEAAFAVSRSQILVPPGLHLDVQGNHAESTGSSGCAEDSLRRGSRESSHSVSSVLHAVHDDACSATRGGCDRGRHDTNQSSFGRSLQPESQDHRAGGDHSETLPAKSVQFQWTNAIEPSELCDDGLKIVRNRRTGGRRNGSASPWSDPTFVSGPKYFPTPSKAAAPSNTGPAFHSVDLGQLEVQT